MAPTLDTPPVGELEDVSGLTSWTASRLADLGFVSVFAVSSPTLEEVERGFGQVAHERALTALAEAVGRWFRENFPHGESRVALDFVASEVAGTLAIPRPGGMAAGVERLPKLAEQLCAHLGRQSARLAYPFSRELEDLRVGVSAVLRDDHVRDERQVVLALERARADAQVMQLVRARDRHWSFLNVLLQEKVHSVFQPVVELATGEVHGFEALARGPEVHGFTHPGALFQAAAEAGLSFQLDCLCRRAALRGASGSIPRSRKLFLNVLPSSIRDPAFRIDRIGTTLDSVGLAPENLVFEVSERESIRHYELFREIVDYYKGVGVRFALDDTGAGYASLEAVMQLEPDYIKVDISLVRAIDTDLGRQTLMSALNTVALSINAHVIAEGIERAEELHTLREIGVTYGQGYLLGRPGGF